jgi:hypothetical protein
MFHSARLFAATPGGAAVASFQCLVSLPTTRMGGSRGVRLQEHARLRVDVATAQVTGEFVFRLDEVCTPGWWRSATPGCSSTSAPMTSRRLCWSRSHRRLTFI